MPKVTYTADKGLVQSAGSGVSLDNSPYLSKTTTVTTVPVTASLPGLTILGASSPNEVLMPLASSFPGGMYIFRSTTAQGHFLTCSAETAGTKAFVQGSALAAQAQNGSKLTLQAQIGASIAVVSDGKNYIVLPGSGSVAFSGT